MFGRCRVCFICTSVRASLVEPCRPYVFNTNTIFGRRLLNVYSLMFLLLWLSITVSYQAAPRKKFPLLPYVKVSISYVLIGLCRGPQHLTAWHMMGLVLFVFIPGDVVSVCASLFRIHVCSPTPKYLFRFYCITEVFQTVVSAINTHSPILTPALLLRFRAPYERTTFWFLLQPYVVCC